MPSSCLSPSTDRLPSRCAQTRNRHTFFWLKLKFKIFPQYSVFGTVSWYYDTCGLEWQWWSGQNFTFSKKRKINLKTVLKILTRVRNIFVESNSKLLVPIAPWMMNYATSNPSKTHLWKEVLILNKVVRVSCSHLEPPPGWGWALLRSS